MPANLLNIGKSGLLAAQVGLSTTGNNIANANVAGYTRQVVMQAPTQSHDSGNGFEGSGTSVVGVTRSTDEFLNAQVRTAQSAHSALTSYEAQIRQIDNMMSDSSTGLSPALQDFFAGVQNTASNPESPASRQALLSSAETLAARFQGLNGRLQEVRDGVNSQIASKVSVINSYGQRIADLNEKISHFSSEGTAVPNDMLDQRDQLIVELNQQIKASVVAGDHNTVTVSIGTGQPLVVGSQAYQLAVTNAPGDRTRAEVGYVNGRGVTILDESTLTGGELGGLMQFRGQSLDRIQNSLGRVAIGLASTFNDQHKLGQDQNGSLGGDFFNIGPAFVGADAKNNPGSTAVVTAQVKDPTALSQSDYRVDYDGSKYLVTRVSDNAQTVLSGSPQRIDGIDFSVSGASAAGDNFIVRPTINGAQDFKVLITDRNKIAAGTPIVTKAALTNAGNATISQGAIDQSYAATPLAATATLSYNGTTNELSGFPAGAAVKVTVGTTTTTYAAGTPVPYTDGAKISFNGITVDMNGTPRDGDTFTVARNTGGVGDNRNMRLLGDLQTKTIFDGGTATYQGAYAEMVGFVGNKTREVQVNGEAAGSLLDQATRSQQEVSGVNLDEEASNLLKYQQAYQAAGKMMQIASTLFDSLLSIGH